MYYINLFQYIDLIFFIVIINCIRKLEFLICERTWVALYQLHYTNTKLRRYLWYIELKSRVIKVINSYTSTVGCLKSTFNIFGDVSFIVDYSFTYQNI